MNFAEQPPSKQWAALKYRGQKFAEVWFKPEGQPFGLTFRIAQESFRVPGLGALLTVENLFKTVGIGTDEVKSWRHGDENGSPSAWQQPLPPPAQEVSHLTIHVSLKPPPGEDVPLVKWQELEARWKTLLGLEAGIESLRLRMEGLRAELDGATNKSLTTEEKAHALNADVAQWSKAKSRVRYSLPKVKEFIHRATWALGVPERKKLEEIFKTYIQPHVPFPELDKVPEQLENLFKDRQVLSAHGTAVYQECKGLSGEIQAALRTLQSNAAANAVKKRAANSVRGKSFKHG